MAMNFDDMMTLINSTSTAPRSVLLTAKEIQHGLLYDALVFIAKGDGGTDQRSFNQAVASKLSNGEFECVADGVEFPLGLQSLFGAAVQRLAAAQQAEEGVAEAQQALEYLLTFLTSLCASVVRSAYFMHRKAEEAEARDLANAEPGDGDKRIPFEFRSAYNGFNGRLVAEPDAIESATTALVDFSLKLHGSLSKACSAWHQKNRIFNCGGYRQDEAFVNFLSVAEAWSHFRLQGEQSAFVKLEGSSAAARVLAGL